MVRLANRMLEALLDIPDITAIIAMFLTAFRALQWIPTPQKCD
jgi:hypothetical protein